MVNASQFCQTESEEFFARIPAAYPGGKNIPKPATGKRATRISVTSAAGSLTATMLIIGSVPESAMQMPAERSTEMGKSLNERIISYRRSMAMVKAMLSEGVIDPKEYAEIDTIMAKKYGLSSCSIFREIDWINADYDGNM
ncbi:MAG: SHOCT domain-containing protein [Pseudoruminococcus massiliensis]|uniref:SHOCT domain-containing protein n=1 Tax=Pseudoruminococcus massiliensis TaxID=2086583 RepID=UPI0039921CBA|nr:hypothetical protein [Oscillospiraceae bacterium]